jgi:hypothetical protein
MTWMNFGFSSQFPRPLFPRNPDGRGKLNERRGISADNCPRKIPSASPPPLGGERNGRKRKIFPEEIRLTD